MKSRRPLELVEVISWYKYWRYEPALLDLVLTNVKDIIKGVMIWGCLGCSKHALVELVILRTVGLTNFGLLKESVDGIPRETVFRDIGAFKVCEWASSSIRSQSEEAGKQRGWARTCWSNSGKRRKSTDNGSREGWPEKSTGMLYGHTEVWSGKPRCNWTWWNWTWLNLELNWKITKSVSIGTFARRERLKSVPLW